MKVSLFTSLFHARSNPAHTDLKQYLKNQYAQLAILKTDTVAEALDKMIRNATSVLVVMDNGQVAGLTSDRDYLKLAQKRKQVPGLPSDEKMQISEIMTPASKLVSCTYTDTVESCQDMMVKNKVRFLPVLHANKLHGVLSFSDFLARPSRFEPDARRAIFAEENVNIVSDDYSFSLSDLEGDKIKEELAKRVESIKNRKL